MTMSCRRPFRLERMSDLLSDGIRSARIAGPVTFEAADGTKRDVPHGPCLIERLDQQRVDVIWGTCGEYSAVLPLEALVSAERRGSLVLLN
jgi:hypothetical protein